MTQVQIELPFSQQIRAATAHSHEAAQATGFMSALFAGRVDRRRYARYVAQNRFIYEALDRAGTALQNDATTGAFIDSRLDRLPSVDADLEHLLGNAWQSSLTPLTSTRRYVEAIAHASTWPGGYVAHHYVRYLGDLSGGQHIARIVKKTFGFEDDGVRGFAFPIDDLAAFKESYRQRLDDAPWGVQERNWIVEEILNAYDLATEMLHDL